MPTQLHCSLCAAIDPTQTTEFSCLAALHHHIKSEHLATLSVSVIPQRKFRRKRRRPLTTKTTKQGKRTANASNRGPIEASSTEHPSNESPTLMVDKAPDEMLPAKKARTHNDHDTDSTANALNWGPIVASSSERPSPTLMADTAPDETQPIKKARTLKDQDTCSLDGLSGPSQDFFPAVGEDPEYFHSMATEEDPESTQPTQKIKTEHTKAEENSQLSAGTSDATDLTGKRMRYRKKTTPQHQQNNGQHNKHIIQ